MPESSLIRDIDRIVLPRGWRRERRNKHVIYKHPRGGMVVMNSSRVSDRSRTRENILSEFRRQERLQAS